MRICELMEAFHKSGWCSGSGGGCSTRSSICEDNILVAPSGVQKVSGVARQGAKSEERKTKRLQIPQTT